MAEIPFILVTSTMFVVPFYFIMGFAVDAAKFFLYWMFVTFGLSGFTYNGQMTMSLVRDAETAQGIGGKLSGGECFVFLSPGRCLHTKCFHGLLLFVLSYNHRVVRILHCNVLWDFDPSGPDPSILDIYVLASSGYVVENGSERAFVESFVALIISMLAIPLLRRCNLSCVSAICRSLLV